MRHILLMLTDCKKKYVCFLSHIVMIYLKCYHYFTFRVINCTEILFVAEILLV